MPTSQRALSRRNPRDAWLQGLADAEQILECKELQAEVDAALDGNKPQAAMPRLVRATRSWLAEIGPGRGTISVLSKRMVAMPVASAQDEFAWQDVLAEGEGASSRFSAVSRWLNEEANCPFCADTVRRLMLCAIQHEFWLPVRGNRRGIYQHEYYHQLLQQLDSTATTRGNLHREAPGVYQCFRPSVIYPGRYVVGLFAVILLADEPRHQVANAVQAKTAPALEYLRTVELHRISPDDEDKPEALERCLIQAPGVEEVFVGYMVKKSRQMLVHAFNSITHSFQYTVISDFLLSESLSPDEAGIPSRERACIQMASGITVGLIGQAGFYSVPTVLLRVPSLSASGCKSDDEIIACLRASRYNEKSVGILAEQYIPEFVLRQFEVIERKVVHHKIGGTRDTRNPVSEKVAESK